MIDTSVEIRVDPTLPQLTGRAWQRFVGRARVLIAQFEAERFATSTDPSGNAWVPLKSATRSKAIQKAILKVGGRAARPTVKRTRSGGLKVVARNPIAGYQRSAVVRRTAQSRILIDTGRLRQSVIASSATADAVREGTRYALIWGTRVPYARAHQFGEPERNLPARPFLGFSPQLAQQLERTLYQVLKEELTP